MKYKNPCATADVIVERNNEILLVKRKHKPFRDMWALPGGFLEYGKETLEETAVRELKEETSLQAKIENLELFGVYSSPKRDPRGHIISHVYIAGECSGNLRADDDAKDTGFFSLDNLPELSFDHNKILKEYKLYNQDRNRRK